jgi:hypothetical protein
MKNEPHQDASTVSTETTSVDDTNTKHELLELVLEGHERQVIAESSKPARIDGVLVGRLVGFVATGEPQVDYPGSDGLVVARVMASLGSADIGRNVALLFEGGDPAKPVIMGLMFVAPSDSSQALKQTATLLNAEAEADGDRIVLTAEKEIVLRCGEASITLTKAGKIIIQGAYVSSRSSGTNRIQGGSVEIN